MIEIKIPNDIFASSNSNISRDVLEAVAIDWFRSNQLSTNQVRILLGFETRDEVHEFLHSRGVPWIDYDVNKVDRELALLREILP